MVLMTTECLICMNKSKMTTTMANVDTWSRRSEEQSLLCICVFRCIVLVVGKYMFLLRIYHFPEIKSDCFKIYLVLRKFCYPLHCPCCLCYQLELQPFCSTIRQYLTQGAFIDWYWCIKLVPPKKAISLLKKSESKSEPVRPYFFC